MPTIRDVAELACVSVATVSRVINHSPSVSEKTRYSVQRAMEVLNYQPNANAQALAVQNTEYHWRGGYRCNGSVLCYLGQISR